MKSFNAIKAALAAVALLVSGFVSTPSLAADNVLFSFSEGSHDQKLVLNGGDIIIEAADTGWYSAPGYTDFPYNDNYIVGTYSGNEYRNFFTFDLSNILVPITSAQLSLFNPYGGYVGAPNTYYLYNSGSLYNDLISGVDSPATFNAMNAGAIIGSQAVSSADDNTQVLVNLSAYAVAVLNQYAGSENGYAITGTLGLSAVPLPAALPMMGAAVAGLFGFARRRRPIAA